MYFNDSVPKWFWCDTLMTFSRSGIIVEKILISICSKMNSLLALRSKLNEKRTGTSLLRYINRESFKYSFNVYRRPAFSISCIHFLTIMTLQYQWRLRYQCNFFLGGPGTCSDGYIDKGVDFICKQLNQLPHYDGGKAINQASKISLQTNGHNKIRDIPAK